MKLDLRYMFKRQPFYSNCVQYCAFLRWFGEYCTVRTVYTVLYCTVPCFVLHCYSSTWVLDPWVSILKLQAWKLADLWQILGGGRKKACHLNPASAAPWWQKFEPISGAILQIHTVQHSWHTCTGLCQYNAAQNLQPSHQTYFSNHIPLLLATWRWKSQISVAAILCKLDADRKCTHKTRPELHKYQCQRMKHMLLQPTKVLWSSPPSYSTTIREEDRDREEAWKGQSNEIFELWFFSSIEPT